jgi:hypothetical protein
MAQMREGAEGGIRKSGHRNLTGRAAERMASPLHMGSGSAFQSAKENITI